MFQGKNSVIPPCSALTKTVQYICFVFQGKDSAVQPFSPHTISVLCSNVRISTKKVNWQELTFPIKHLNSFRLDIEQNPDRRHFPVQEEASSRGASGRFESETGFVQFKTGSIQL